ncbi:DUF3696 domain-containing protein [Spirosoma linguale]|uniref:SMC domain protein n=1 Tax=Spirosoma linguale (strain ATCC 33905 / DSM 74 / LMG 10896 / Claus 1) TaxID=504472 RepID=D2QQ04_SPILD|nr:SMC domain protein [Spirosoma linguale DSM 74]
MLINSLSLKNFKCFEELDVKFAPITLLTGANSSGKSSLINAILAVLQTRGFPYYLSLNGSYVSMGSFEDIIYGRDASKKLELQIKIQDQYILTTRWESDSHEQANFSGLEYKDEKFTTDGPNIQTGEFGWKHDIINSAIDPEKIFFELTVGQDRFDFNYISSFRLSPERTYYRQSGADFKIMKTGELYIDQIIEWEDNSSAKFQDLTNILQKLELVQSIKSSILKGGRFELNVKVHKASQAISLVDVGFGISQFLPIIVADLQLSDKSCLAISQPEIHLHPKIQAQFGNYLASQVNQTEKQYIVETHSEYLLNRIRLLLVTGELKPNQVRVLYFENDGIKSTKHDIEFATDGQIKGAPQGFFDTYGIDVMDIAMNAHE